MPNQLALTSPQIQVRQQKKGRKEEIPAMCCHSYVNWTPASPTSSTVGLDTGSHFPRKDNKPPFPIAAFTSGSLGPLELWYRYGPDEFKIIQHFFPLKSYLVCFPVLRCALLLLLQRSGTFSLGFPLPVARPQTCLHQEVIEYPLVDILENISQLFIGPWSLGSSSLESLMFIVKVHRGWITESTAHANSCKPLQELLLFS